MHLENNFFHLVGHGPGYIFKLFLICGLKFSNFVLLSSYVTIF